MENKNKGYEIWLKCYSPIVILNPLRTVIGLHNPKSCSCNSTTYIYREVNKPNYIPFIPLIFS